MTQASLYRRHRPQSFAEVVGQEHVVRTLSNAIERDRVHHAYLFVGSRGTGKTSLAKILARSLNCIEGPTLRPCGKCDSCREIATGTSLDVAEMDAASNRSVEHIRDLRERVNTSAAAGRWKVYILDEAHMLTREAWNAFLKTLEEPPPRTVFVLATTEAHKVMPTIVDRCQRFDFQRPSSEQIASVVRRVAEAESLWVEPEAVSAIARAASGSFRDALGTLDQLVSYCGQSISAEEALTVLGISDTGLVVDAVQAICDGDGAGVLGVSARLADSGRDVAQFGRDLIGYLRRLVVLRVAGELPEQSLIEGADLERMSEQAEAATDLMLTRAIDAIAAAVAAIGDGDEPRLTLEIALLRAARPQLDPSREAVRDRLERLEQAFGAGSQPPGPAPAPAPAEPSASPQAAGDEARGEAADAARTQAAAGDEAADAARTEASAAGAAVVTAPGKEPGDRAGASASPLDPDEVRRRWDELVEHLFTHGFGVVASLLREGSLVDVDPAGSGCVLGVVPEHAYVRTKLGERERRAEFAEATAEVFGTRLGIEVVELEESSGRAGAEPLDERELIERMIDELDASEVMSQQETADEEAA